MEEEKDLTSKDKQTLALLWAFAFSLMLGGFIIGYAIGYRQSKPVETHTDTVVVTDTIVHHAPKVTYERSLGYVPVTIPIVVENGSREEIQPNDSVTENLTKVVKLSPDSMVLHLPVAQRVYEDSLYKAYVSGFRLGDYPRLDSIRITQRTEYVTRTITQKARRKPWGVGVTAGYGVGSGGLSPFVGVGVQYSLVGW